jgi:hypothetical protein
MKRGKAGRKGGRKKRREEGRKERKEGKEGRKEGRRKWTNLSQVLGVVECWVRGVNGRIRRLLGEPRPFST